ncbi:flagellar protein FlgN [Puniceibacterium confluentis]|uniref:flagellar protein FlgN n=2 Tax=Puniceibacterium confluentis TaxID=1958944 RepID=UPI00356AA48B
MMEQTDADITVALDRLLDEERTALLAGELSRIEGIIHRKSALIDALAESSIDDFAAVSALQVKLRRNQTLFDQALAGIRTVASRLSSLRQLRKTLETYDHHGRKSALLIADNTKLERRA